MRYHVTNWPVDIFYAEQILIFFEAFVEKQFLIFVLFPNNKITYKSSIF